MGFFKKQFGNLKSGLGRASTFVQGQAKKVPGYIKAGLQASGALANNAKRLSEKASTLKNIADNNGLKNAGVDKAFKRGSDAVNKLSSVNDRVQNIGGQVLNSNVF